MFAQLLGTAATAYGVLAGLTALLQARQMLARRTSCEVSARFLASYAGGYAIWLTYGFSTGSLPLIVVDIVGLLCGGLTLTVALSLRGSLIRPATWNSCEATSISQRPAAPDERPHTHAASPSHDLCIHRTLYTSQANKCKNTHSCIRNNIFSILFIYTY
jgi:uncharacterized protein with PQ loop repeat